MTVAWAGYVARIGERIDVYWVLVGKNEGKRPLGKPWRRWEDNIKMDIQEVGCVGVDWIELAQDRESWQALVNLVWPDGSVMVIHIFKKGSHNNNYRNGEMLSRSVAYRTAVAPDTSYLQGVP